MTNILIALIIGGITGWLAGLIRRGHGFGIVTNIILGIIGGVVGGLIFSIIGGVVGGLIFIFLGIQDTNFIGSIAVSTIGAVIVLAIANALKKA